MRGGCAGSAYMYKRVDYKLSCYCIGNLKDLEGGDRWGFVGSIEWTL